MELLKWAFLGTPVLVGAGWWYARKEQVTPVWRRRALLIALSVVTVNAALYYLWWSAAWILVGLSVGDEHARAIKEFLGNNVVLYLAPVSFVSAALGKGTARVCAAVAVLSEVLLWSNVGFL